MPREEALLKIFYLAAAVLFIFGIKGLSHPRTAVRGNLLAALGMLLAIVVTLTDKRIVSFQIIVAGIVVGGLVGVLMAYRAPMTAMPQVVAIFNGFGGGASALAVGAAFEEALKGGWIEEIMSIEALRKYINTSGTFNSFPMDSNKPGDGFFIPDSIRLR